MSTKSTPVATVKALKEQVATLENANYRLKGQLAGEISDERSMKIFRSLEGNQRDR